MPRPIRGAYYWAIRNNVQDLNQVIRVKYDGRNYHNSRWVTFPPERLYIIKRTTAHSECPSLVQLTRLIKRNINAERT